MQCKEGNACPFLLYPQSRKSPFTMFDHTCIYKHVEKKAKYGTH